MEGVSKEMPSFLRVSGFSRWSNYSAKTILNLPFTEPIRCRTFALYHGVIKPRRHCERSEAIQYTHPSGLLRRCAPRKDDTISNFIPFFTFENQCVFRW